MKVLIVGSSKKSPIPTDGIGNLIEHKRITHEALYICIADAPCWDHKGVDIIDHTSIFLLRTINHCVILIICIQLTLSNSNTNGTFWFVELQRDSNYRNCIADAPCRKYPYTYKYMYKYTYYRNYAVIDSA